MDGATPIVVIDTNDIIQSLQRATIKNKERESNNRQQPHNNGNALCGRKNENDQKDDK